MVKTVRLKNSDLVQFTGTAQWYRPGTNRSVFFTEGAKYVADSRSPLVLG